MLGHHHLTVDVCFQNWDTSNVTLVNACQTRSACEYLQDWTVYVRAGHTSVVCLRKKPPSVNLGQAWRLFVAASSNLELFKYMLVKTCLKTWIFNLGMWQMFGQTSDLTLKRSSNTPTNIKTRTGTVT